MDIPKKVLSSIQRKVSTTLIPFLEVDYNESETGIEKGFEISIYRKGELLSECSDEERKELFNRLQNGFTMNIDLLRDTFQIMKDEKWTKEKVLDAYKHVLKTHVWNTDVKPAELLSYDKKVKFNTYYEICNNISNYVAIYYQNIYRPLYILKTEQERFNFPLWDEKYRKKIKTYWLDEKTGEKIEL